MNRDKIFPAWAVMEIRKELRVVILIFPPNMILDRLDLPPTWATVYAQMFRRDINAAFGELPYNAATLPIKVIANRESGQVESHLPSPMNALVANPEVYLAWAEKLEDAARSLIRGVMS